MHQLRNLLYPFTILWGMILFIRHTLYNWQILSSFQSKKTFTVVVGNLNLGGTGKTPFTESLVQHFKKNYKVAVLSRGYGRKTTGLLEITHESSPEISGDEPLQMKLKFPDIPVYVSENRKKGIQHIENEYHPDIIILDDAFQHRKITGHVQVLLTPYRQPYYKDELLPVGRLRDIKSAANRADFLLVSKGPEHIPQNHIVDLQHFTSFSYKDDLFYSYLEYGKLVNPVNQKTLGLKSLERVLLVTGIAHPEPIVEYFKEEFLYVNLKKYPDHHPYDEDDIQDIKQLFGNFDANTTALVTTSKDYPKLKMAMDACETQLPFYVLPVEMHISDQLGEYFFELLEERLKKFKANKRSYE